MAKTLLTVRMDEELKQEFDDFCADVGMNSSVAVTLFVRTVLRERRIPFEITNRPPLGTVSAVRAGDKELDEGRLPEYDSVDGMMKDLSK